MADTSSPYAFGTAAFTSRGYNRSGAPPVRRSIGHRTGPRPSTCIWRPFGHICRCRSCGTAPNQPQRGFGDFACWHKDRPACIGVLGGNVRAVLARRSLTGECVSIRNRTCPRRSRGCCHIESSLLPKRNRSRRSASARGTHQPTGRCRRGCSARGSIACVSARAGTTVWIGKNGDGHSVAS